jgi:hypothetical protein
MDVDNASNFLACSILASAAIAILGITTVFINNLIHKYWKPVRIFTKDSWHFNPPPRFATDEELKHIDPAWGEIRPVDPPVAKTEIQKTKP